MTSERGRRRLRSMAVVAALLVLVAATGLVWSYRHTQKAILVEVDGLSETVRTHRLTVGDLLEELDISLLPEDTLSPDRDTSLGDDLLVRIHRARRVEIEASGRVWIHLTQAQTVGEVLAENGLVLDTQDLLWLEDQRATLKTPLPIGEDTIQPPRYAKGHLWEQVEPVPARLRIQRAVLITVDDGGLPFSFFTTAATVGEALLAEQVTVYLGDTTFPRLDSPVSAGLTVFIERSTPIVVLTDGNTLKTRTRQQTVGDVLAEQGVALAGFDRVSPSLTTSLLDNMVIQVTRMREATEIEQELLPFDSTWIADDGLEIDHQRLDEPGQEGVTNTRFRVIDADGQEISRTLEYTWVAQEPITRTLAYGRKVVTRTLETPEGPMVYWRKIRMSATSYSASTAGVSPSNPYYGYTRLGDKMRHGIVAVDPAVIRLGTNVYVPGYGPGYVGDTGSAIKGKRIDLGYDDDNLVLWRQWVDVYLLAPVPPTYQIKYVLPNWPRE